MILSCRRSKRTGVGVFAYALLKGPGGKVAVSGEAVTIRKPMDCVEEKIPVITKKDQQESQYSVVDSRGMDFPLLIAK